jgi:AraC family transcriptional regulator
MNLRPVRTPARSCDLLRSAETGTFTITEAKHCRAIGPHAHEHWTLTILLGGSFEERYVARRAPLNCERFAVLMRRPGEVHEDRFGREGAHNLVLELDDAAARRLGGFAPIEHAIGGADLEIVSRRLHREMSATDAARHLALEGLGLELMAAFARSLREKPSDRGVVDRVRALLTDRFRDASLRIADVAAEFDMHPVALARAFRTRTGSSPSDLIRRLRLEWVRAEVERSTRPLALIAHDAGFADQSHMTRAFRAAYGVTPARLRATCRSQATE